MAQRGHDALPATRRIVDDVEAGVDPGRLGALEEAGQGCAVGIVQAGQDESPTDMQEAAFHARLDGLGGDRGIGADVVQHRALSRAVHQHHRGRGGQLRVDPLDMEVRRRDGPVERGAEEVVTGGDDEPRLDAHAGQHAAGAQGRAAFGRGERVDEAEDADGQTL